MGKNPGAPRGKAARHPGEDFIKKRPGSEVWQIDYTVNGRRYRRSSETTDMAQAAEAALIAQQATYDAVVLGKRVALHMTLKQAADKFYEQVARFTPFGSRVQRSQLIAIQAIVGPDTLLADLNIALVNGIIEVLRSTTIQRHRTGRRSGFFDTGQFRGPATINSYISTLSSVCTLAREKWLVEVGAWKLKDALLKLGPQRETLVPTDRCRALMSEIVPHARAIVFIGLCTGLRSKNVHSLTWQQITLGDKPKVTVIAKGNKKHTVALPEVAVQTLLSLEPDPQERWGAVFKFGNPHVGCRCATCGNHMMRGATIGTVSKAFIRAAEVIGMPDLTFHGLRHTFASRLLANSGDLELVRQALGHSNIQTTLRYAHLVDGRKEQVINAAAAGLMDEPEDQTVVPFKKQA